jgi:hypothetical protein
MWDGAEVADPVVGVVEAHHSLDATRGGYFSRISSFPRLAAAFKLHIGCAGPR